MQNKTAFGIALLALTLPWALACGGGSSPTEPPGAALRLTQASVLVDGNLMNGMTVSMNHGSGGPTRFEATLQTVSGRPAAGRSVRVSYTRPGGMMMNRGEFTLYDDGTHGDHIAGDGIYCFEDWGWQYGCAGNGMYPGEYHYEFYGMHHDGAHSNHVNVQVTLR